MGSAVGYYRRAMLSFRRLSIISMVATLLLVAVGGLVRATNSGLGCGDDWPVCNGKVIPLFDNYTVAIEFSHRFVAGLLIISISLLVLSAFREYRDRPRVVRASVGALGLVLFQAVLGAIVVKLDLKAESVVIHLVAAMLLLALLVYIASAASVINRSLAATPEGAVSRRAWLMAGSVLVLLAVGSYVSGLEAGLAFVDWPLMDGRLIPDLSVDLRVVQFLHRALAAVVGILLVVIALPIMRRKQDLPLASRLAHIAVGTFALEVLVGAANVWTRLNAGVVTLHLALGATIWAASVGIAVVTSPSLERELAPVGGHRKPAMEAGT